MRIAITLTLLFFSLRLIHAQTSKPTPPSKARQENSQERPDQVNDNRVTAIAMLKSLATEAKSYRDTTLRGRVLARVADVLWDSDKEVGRELFFRAWESVESIEVPTSTFAAKTTKTSTNRDAVQLRAEILRLAARHHSKLVEELLGKKARELSIQLGSDRPLPRVVSQSESLERLRIASQLLEDNNLANALAIASPAFNQPSAALILFLIRLRELDPNAADNVFANLITAVKNDPGSDANTVSLLSTFAFTPSVLITVSANGFPSGMSYQAKPAPNLSPALRRQFLQVSSRILLAPFNQLESTSAGRAGTLYIARRLFPLFQQYAPDLAPALSAQITALTGDSVPLNDAATDLQNRGIKEETEQDPSDLLEAKLSQAKTAKERDRAYAMAAIQAADHADMRALDFVWKIEDEETRKGVTNFVEFSLTQNLLRAEKVDDALRLLKKSSLTPVQRARVSTTAASHLLKDDIVRARELLNDAVKDAERTPDNERAYLYIALMEQFASFDQVRSWELLNEAIKSANNIADFTGESGSVAMTTEGNFSVRLVTELAPKDSLANGVALLAKDDFFQAINVAKMFRNDAPRAVAVIAIAKSQLEAPALKTH